MSRSVACLGVASSLGGLLRYTPKLLATQILGLWVLDGCASRITDRRFPVPSKEFALRVLELIPLEDHEGRGGVSFYVPEDAKERRLLKAASRLK